MSEDRELLNCPFCGSDQQALVTSHGTTTDVFHVWCKGPGNLNGYCNAEGPRNFQSIELAIEAWNTRASWQKAKPDREMLVRFQLFNCAHGHEYAFSSDVIDGFLEQESQREAWEKPD